MPKNALSLSVVMFVYVIINSPQKYYVMYKIIVYAGQKVNENPPYIF